MLAGDGTSGQRGDDRVAGQVDIWRRELIGLTRSNRLLYFRRTKVSTLEIIPVEVSFDEVVRHLQHGASWGFRPQHREDADEGADDDGTSSGAQLDPRALLTDKPDPKSLAASLSSLNRRATQEFMEKGIWILYLVAGMLHWTDPESREDAESPIVLIPVELARESLHEPFVLRAVEEEIVTNPALAVKTSEFGIELPAVEDDDVAATLTAVEAAVRSEPSWQVERRLVLGTFSFHKEVMYRDLLKNEKVVQSHPLVRALALGSSEGGEHDFDLLPDDELDNVAPPEEVATILDADSTQRQCIHAASHGSSFVMDGPPGTGKSQTISNMIAELLAKGKTVLFASEKAAALEVVHKRLLAASLADFCLELHSHKATRKEVAQKLGRALTRHPIGRPGMASGDRAQLVRVRQELSARSEVMNEVRQPLDRSLFAVLGRIAQLQESEQAPPPESVGLDTTADDLARILSLARQLAQSWGPVEQGDGFLWRDLADETADASRQQRSRERIENAKGRLLRLELASRDAAEALALRHPDDFAAADLVGRALSHVENRPGGVLPEWLRAASLDPTQTLAERRRATALAYGRVEKELIEGLGARWRELPVDTAETLDTAVAALQREAGWFSLAEELDTGELSGMAEYMRTGMAELDQINRDTQAIATSFGLEPAPTTLERATRLAKLAGLAGSVERPEANWLSQLGAEQVRHAIAVLRPICAAVRELRDQLSTVFTNGVLDMDLEGLVQRFQQLHHGFGKLRGQYRRDKKTVAAIAHVGRTTPEVLSQLPAALKWQRLATQLAAIELDQSALIGSYYYRSADTDFDVIERCLEVADRAFQLAEGRLGPHAVRQLARDEAPDLDVTQTASRLGSRAASWPESATAAGVDETIVAHLVDVPLGELADLCRESASILGRLVDLAETVHEIAGRYLTLGELHRLADERKDADASAEALAMTRASDVEHLGDLYLGVDTNWDGLFTALDWAGAMRELMAGAVPSITSERLAAVSLDASSFDSALSNWRLARAEIVAEFTGPWAEQIESDLGTTFEDADQLLDDLAHTVGDIEEWAEHRRLRQMLSDLGVKSAVTFCEARRIPSDHVAAVIERSCLERWADAVIEADRNKLGRLRSDQLDQVVSEFRQLDRRLIEGAAAGAISRCNAERPRTTVGAAGIIAREAAKSKRHMPVKRLFEETAEVAQALKPCFMMTPMTVSQFLPPSMHFDAVIFDEASQVRPSDAINCVYRGTQLIVAGDEKQLPPTSFFDRSIQDGDDEWEEEQYDDFQSVLELAKGSGGLRELPLRWHYRSQHEDLIAYSNYSFYEGRLITFPSAEAVSDDLGVKFFHVPDGIYRRGGARDNPREADEVAGRVMEWAQRAVEDPGRARTLGVVAFSEAQASMVEAAVERRRLEHPELESFFSGDRLDGFFVKNLENVQGDERDVMIFSVGYGRDEVGKLTMNFGPLNRSGGIRRLNVAITRSRRRVELIASITGTEPEFNSTDNVGIRHLQRYLRYATEGPSVLALEIAENGLDAESPFEEEVIRLVRSWGYDVVPQVGTAGYRVDIGVKHPARSGRFLLGIECDGAAYHSTKAARDRDRIRAEILSGLGWRLHRVWGTAWYRNRPEEEQKLRAAIDAALKLNDSGMMSPDSRAAERWAVPRQEFEEVRLDSHPDWMVPYEVAQVQVPFRLRYEMHEHEAFPVLCQLLVSIVDSEGPIEDEFLLRRAREAWGVQRAGSRIRDAFTDAVRQLAQRRELERIEGRFSRTAPEQMDRVRAPTDDERSHRSAGQICLTERKLAICHLVEDARAVSRDELTFEVARLFGWNRRGSDIQLVLAEAVDALVSDGVLEEVDGLLKLANRSVSAPSNAYNQARRPSAKSQGGSLDQSRPSSLTPRL